MPKAVTLRDVAREAGVHVSTASRALNVATRAEVNVDTADRVLDAAARLGYQPHPLARGLRTNRTWTVGMVVPDLMNPLFPPIFAGAQAVLSGDGYSLLIGADDDANQPDTVMTTFLERRVDGLIVASAHRDFTAPEALLRHEVPTVLVNRSVRDTSFPAIVGNDRAGIRLVVRHLVDLGHRNIVHIAGPPEISTGLYRRAGFVDAMRLEGLANEPAVFEAGSFRAEDGEAACVQVLDSAPDATAIVAANDLIALGCIDAVRASGRRVPADMSVTGYNDMSFVDRLDPPLTTVSVPYRRMGAEAARLLLGLMAEDDTSPEYAPVLLPPELVVRRSTAPPRPVAGAGFTRDRTTTT